MSVCLYLSVSVCLSFCLSVSVCLCLRQGIAHRQLDSDPWPAAHHKESEWEPPIRPQPLHQPQPAQFVQRLPQTMGCCFHIPSRVVLLTARQRMAPAVSRTQGRKRSGAKLREIAASDRAAWKCGHRRVTPLAAHKSCCSEGTEQPQAKAGEARQNRRPRHKHLWVP